MEMFYTSTHIESTGIADAEEETPMTCKKRKKNIECISKILNEFNIHAIVCNN